MVVKRRCVAWTVLSNLVPTLLVPALLVPTLLGVSACAGNVDPRAAYEGSSADSVTSEGTDSLAGAPTTSSDVQLSGATAPTNTGATTSNPTLDAAGLGAIAIQHHKSQVLSRLTNSQFLHAASALLGIDAAPFAVQIPDIAPNAGYSNSGHAQSQPYDLVVGFDSVARAMTDAVTDWAALSLRYGDCNELACIDTFIQSFGERAFRRPLLPNEVASLRPIVDAATAEGLSYQDTLSLLVRAFLQAPEFLYVFEDVPLTDHQLATRLAFFLTDGPPDDELHAVAKAGTLVSSLDAQATRLLNQYGDRFASAFIYDYFDLRKAYQRTVDVDDVTIRAMIDSLKATFGELIARDAALSELLTTTSYQATPELATHLGLQLGDGRVAAPEVGGFIGLVTHPATLIAISNAYEGSMVSRGLFLAHQLLCIPPTPPPARAFDPSEVAGVLPPDPTQRDEAEARLEDPNCLGCHIQFEPYAFALNHWAGDGRYNPDERLHDGGPIKTTLGELNFTSYKDFFPLLAKSNQFQTCMTDHLIQYAVRHTNYDNAVTDTVLASAKQGGVSDPSIASLLRLIVQHPIFGNR